MFYIGQNHIMRQLQFLLPHVYETSTGINLLLRGPSGWGKTRMAFMICNYLSGRDYEYCLGDKPVFSASKRVHFIDEVHLIADPEFLYPKMDSGNYVIILASNDVSQLKEALINRCLDFNFDRYSVEELRVICRSYLEFKAGDDVIDYIINSGGGNPRIIKSLCYRLGVLHKTLPEIDNIDIVKFKEIMSSVFGIVGGVDVICSRYLEALRSVGGTASIGTLSSILHVDKATIMSQVEPVLLYKSKIKITNKGRSLS